MLIALLFINLTLGLTVLAILPFAAVATVVFQQRVVPRLHRRPGEGQRGQRRPAGERGRPAGVPGLPPGGAQRWQRFAGRSDDYRRSRLRAQRYIALYFPFIQSLSTVAGALVLLVAAGQMRSGALTAGALIAYLLYIDMLFSPVQMLSQVFDGYQQAAVAVRRISETAADAHLDPAGQPPRGAGPPGRARIEFRGRALQLRGRPGPRRWPG